MIPTENAEVVRRQFAAFERGLDAVVEFWHPDIEWQAVAGAADDIGVMKGQAAVRRYYSDWIETFDELRAEVDEVLFDVGEQVAASVRNSGRGRTSGVTTEGRYFVVCTVRDSLIVCGREYGTAEQALDAARTPDGP